MQAKISRETLSGDFVQRVGAISGQELLKCNQCGKCSAGCPVAFAMDLLPSQVIRLAQLGLEQEALSCQTIWCCASCLACVARCPKGVDLPRVMEALRLIVLRQGIDHVAITNIARDDLAEAPQQAFISGFRKYIS